MFKVNGIEYAFGANKIVGMSGIFTCTPKESPGYEFRETLDFGKVRTTKKTWIRIPKEKMFDQSISSVLGVSHDSCDKEAKETVFADPSQTPTGSQQSYFFREIETFTDGHAVIHSMAREYLGTDYDLLRKNCCTFSRDVCLRMGVKEEDIPSWFHNAAKAGADAEDVIANAEQSVKTMFDCAYDSDHNIEYEGIGHGFEVVADKEHANFKVIETTPTWDGRFSSQRQPLLDNDEQLNDQVRETIAWTY